MTMAIGSVLCTVSSAGLARNLSAARLPWDENTGKAHPASTGAITSMTRSLAASPRQCAHTTPATTTRMPAVGGMKCCHI